MSEVLRVGVIFREQDPQIVRGLVPAEIPWKLELFEEGVLPDMDEGSQRGFLAIFFPCDGDPIGNERRLARIFPSAAIIGYTTGMTGVIGRTDGIPVVQVPMPLDFARRLLEGIARLPSVRSAHPDPGRTRDASDFFESFLDMVEASWAGSDRAPGVCRLLKEFADCLDAQEAALYLQDEGAADFHRAYSTGNLRDIDLFEHHANHSIVDAVLKKGELLVDNDFDFEIKPPFSMEKLAIRSLICCPMVRRGEKIGVLEILNKKNGHFTPEDLSLVRKLVDPLSIVIGNVRMLDRSERLTTTDDLTKLYNYRYLMQYLDGEVKRCLRYKKKVSLLFIDVDGFKRINDTFGHLVGSLALSEIGQVLRRILRETDVVGRYGGDEFVVVLPETPLNGALVIAERIRKKVEDYEFVAQDLNIHLTVSLGVANCPKHTLTAEGLIKKADAAMYRAKELSKNNIKVAV